MDSNVSKNTNSHNFFKLRLNPEKLGISVKNLLKQELLSILDLYQQKLNVQIEQKIITLILENKIAISNHKNRHLSPAKFMSIKYACPLGMTLARDLQQSPQAIMQQLHCLLLSTKDSPDSESLWLLLEILPCGWLNFHLDSQFLAGWLERSLFKTQATFTTEDIINRGSENLFALQYLHARCCSLLRLGAAEDLITLSPTLKILHPEFILWLDEQNNLWFTKSVEDDLIRQLLTIADCWFTDNGNHNWSKLALDLSQIIGTFLADCRFLGEVKVQYPHKAIARLGLIALVQFWLEKILRGKLKIAAPQEM